jgi:WKF domain
MVSESPSAATKKKGKKRRISKHMVNARLKSTQDGTEPTPALVANAESLTVVKKQKISSKLKHVKDPTDVAGYLTAWKSCTDEKQNDSTPPFSSKSSWKFNKNMQSWLIRHLYDGSKVSKAVFTDALLYFGKANDAVQLRLRQDATLRAFRYQKYISSTKESYVSNSQSIGTIVDGPEKDSKNNDASSSRGSNINEEKSKTVSTGDAQWLELNDHDRRKEYKRARKVLDTLTIPADENNS